MARTLHVSVIVLNLGIVLSACCLLFLVSSPVVFLFLGSASVSAVAVQYQ